MSLPVAADDRYIELSLESVLLRVADHVGVFYRGDEERDAFVTPLVAAALAADCGVIYVCDRSAPDQVAQRLIGAAVDVEEARRRGQIRIVASTEVYLAGGCFDPARTVDFYQRASVGSDQRGYPVVCVIGEMSWSLRGCPGTERLLEYEALYAREFGTAAAITLCLYDLEQTRGEQIFDLLRLHHRVVLNGIEMQNPCVDPGVLLGGAAP
ncbi:MEDS domain-containing protein [Pseudonocardia sp.]|uniref:MEDS domain-containing protein n=1 Tax=Pseudonocardia sp. TaxID=60912 RepID=UPI00261BFF3B|nr:MEDS domain-containing protein [Pseudonocardia sp.]